MRMVVHWDMCAPYLRKVLELCVCVTLAASSILKPALVIPWITWRTLTILLVLEWRTGQSPGGSTFVSLSVCSGRM